jgi:hypothetical protein
MGRRIFLFLGAMFMALLAERFWVGHAGRAADDCMTKPDAAPPQGSHWYYRLDRTNHRQCWYLAAEGAKVRPQARQAASQVGSQGAKPIARSQASTDAAPYEGTPAQVIPAQPTSVEMTVGQAGADEDDAAPAASKNWSFLSLSPVSNARDAISTTHGVENNQSGAMPLPPVVAPAEPRVIEPRDEHTAAQWNTVLLAVAGFAAMIVAVAFAAFALRKRSRSNAQRRSASSANPRQRGKQAFSNVAKVAAPAGQAETPRNQVQVPPPPSRSVDDIERSVRRLLHEVQRRQDESIGRKDGHGTTMKRRTDGLSMAVSRIGSMHQA